MKTVSAGDFNDWVKRGRSGSICRYHVGFLAVDRFHIISLGPDQLTYKPDENVDPTGRAALNAFADGKVHLYQRKLHDMEYEYIAVKASRRNW